MNVNTPNEIVKDLCERAEDANRRGYSGEASELIEISSLIESLTTENKRLTDHAENLRLDYVDLLAEKESLATQLATKTTLLDAAIAGQETLQSEITRQDEKIARLTEECTESQRREKAAVEDMNVMAAGLPCDVCANKDKNPCGYGQSKKCFTYRGLMAGEGNNDEQI